MDDGERANAFGLRNCLGTRGRWMQISPASAKAACALFATRAGIWPGTRDRRASSQMIADALQVSSSALFFRESM